ncbi:hypothetical protein VTK56DRAFT_6716 [Thermocarpiscus australiensis]
MALARQEKREKATIAAARHEGTRLYQRTNTWLARSLPVGNATQVKPPTEHARLSRQKAWIYMVLNAAIPPDLIATSNWQSYSAAQTDLRTLPY